ncbi:MAG: Rap1a/Tai family immunity protein [Gammaproteobacteria bacterium]
MSKIIVATIICTIMSSANAAVYHFFNGEKLAEAALEWENSQTYPKDSDLLLVTEFAGYVGAMFDHLSEKQHICSPDEITKNDVLRVVTDFLKTTRKGLKFSGSVLVQDALYKKYPCK